jgi:PTS system sucrose-specific IIC component
MSKEQQLAEEIIKAVGGKENIASAESCMTRLRVSPQDYAKINKEILKKIPGVLGIVEQGGQCQIVLGPGVVSKVFAEVSKITGTLHKTQKDLQTKFADMKAKQSPFKKFFKTISNIFIPIIPAIIASGLMRGITAVCINAGIFPQDADWVKILGVLGSALFAYLMILVGSNAAKEFGGTVSMGGLIGAIMVLPDISKITVFTEPLVPGRGGVLGVLLVVWVMCLVERNLRKRMPNAIDVFMTPFLTLLVTGFATFYVLQPIGGFLSDKIVWFFYTLTNLGSHVGAQGSLMSVLVDTLCGAALAGTFLPVVMTGLHQGLIAIHTELIKQTGVTALYPILAMCGAGQVGAVVAVYFKTKSQKMKDIIKGALPAGMLGIGEPLIYGVTLPLGKPFITACCGAAFGGAWQCAVHSASVGFGVSGLPLVLLIHNNPLNYLIGVLISYVAGFTITWIAGFKDLIEE